MVKKDVNLGSLVPIGLFLVVQTVGVVWWASDVSRNLQVIQAEMNSQAEENLRQWARINENEDAITDQISSNRETAAEIRSLRRNIASLSQAVSANNSLLRDYLRTRGEE